MRFALLLAALFAAGTWGAGMYLGMIPAPNGIVHGVGFATSRLKTVRFNPVRAAYDEVRRQVTNPDRAAALGLQGAAVSPPDFSLMLNAFSAPVAPVQTDFTAEIAPPNQQFNTRMDDARAAAWRRPSPH